MRVFISNVCNAHASVQIDVERVLWPRQVVGEAGLHGPAGWVVVN